MPSYAAFLRGVSPMNLKMATLKQRLEELGFKEVKTVLSSGNVVFSARKSKEAALQKKIEAALASERFFLTFVRSIEDLRAIVDSDPFAKLDLPAKSKPLVTFLQKAPTKKLSLPMAVAADRIWSVRGNEAFCSYVSGPNGPTFMKLIETTFTKDVTTRTWETVKKVLAAGEAVSAV